MIWFICESEKRMIQMNLFTKQTVSQTYSYQSGKWGRINQEFGINRDTLSYIKWITSRIYSIVIAYKGKESEKEYI